MDIVSMSLKVSPSFSVSVISFVKSSNLNISGILRTSTTKKEIGELRRLRETLYTEVINYANSINIYVKKPEIASVDYDGLTYNEAVIRCACTVFGALETDLKSKSRKREAVWARYYIWARYKQNNPKTPLHKVGKLLGDITFHHATILYGIQAFERLELYDNEYQKKIEQTDLLINNFLTDAAK
jgi:chromosomal replication initiation ATPase DnaA